MRLDHGYALTVASAQGLTVDRCFLLANRRPSRETIYPAATRHRDRLDIYVDRAPVEAAVRARRSEDIAGDAVTDKEVTDHLARAWSRERRKEAAGDYMTPGMREAVFGARKIEPAHDAPGRVAANDSGDGALSDLALRIRYGEIEIRHGSTVEGLGKACRGLNKSLAAWDGRRRTEGNAAVAMDPGFRADLRAAGAVLRAARPYMKDDPLHRRLLAERGGIAAADLQELAARRRRGRSIRDMSIAGRRAADPGFVPAPPARRPQDARVEMIGRALEALKPAGHSHGVPVDPVEPSIGTAAMPTPAKQKPKPRQKPSQVDTRPAAVSAAEAVALHRRFLANAIVNRRAARSRGLHPYQTEEAPGLIEQARALLRLEALPAARARALRDDVARYDEWFNSGRRAPKPAPGAEQPRRAQRKSRAQAEFDALHDRFLADARANRTAADRRGVHPYETEEAPKIVELARELLRRDALPAAKADSLRHSVAAYDEWLTSRRASKPARVTEQTPRPRAKSRQAPRPAPTASAKARRDAPPAKPRPSRPPAPEPRAQSRPTAATPSPAAARAAEKERAAERERAENRARNRARIEAFLRRAPEIERRHMELSIAAIGQDGAESATAREEWLGDARAVRDEGEALERDIPKRELEAHLAACGASPFEIGSRTHAIRTGIELVEKDLAEHARRQEAAKRAKRDAGRAREEERVRAAQAERTRRREGAAPDSGAVPDPDTPQPSDRDRRAAAKLATRLDDCLARRETLLERAETTLHPSRPVADLGRPHAAWRRKANRAIAAGRELLGNPRYAPLLDAHGGRERIEAATARLEKAALFDNMPAPIARAWEAVEDRVRETGRHRYFLDEHHTAWIQTSLWPGSIRGDAAWRFVKEEAALRGRMDAREGRLRGAADRLRACAAEREAAPDGPPFVERAGYGGWRARAHEAVQDAARILGEREAFALHFAERPGLEAELGELSSALGRAMDGESAEWERIEAGRARVEAERERIERERRREEREARERRRDRHISMGRGLSM